MLRAARIVVIDNEVELLESSNRDRLLEESDCTHAQHLPYLVDSIGKPHAHYGPGRPLLGIARLDIFLRELRQVTVASGSLRVLITASQQVTALLLDSRNVGFDVLLPSYDQLKVLYKPIPTSVADIVRIPSCLEPYLYFDLLISIAFCCSLRFFMPVK